MTRILLIDDDQVLLQALAGYLEAEKYGVSTSSDGLEGLGKALQENPDLIVLDHDLPSLTGLEICRRLRNGGLTIPIIMLTGKKKEELDRILGLELGADDYLLKPIGSRELLARINAVLRRTAPETPAASPTKTFRVRTQKLARGSLFAGRYEVIEELGKGGMGSVYRVLDTQVGEEVAVKLLHPEIATDPDVVERFRNEVRLARKITHPNVGRIFDLHDDAGTPYISMEYVPGEDLQSLIRRGGPLTVSNAVGIAGQLAEGLAAAHQLGVVHRDLKPQNIMIDQNGHARIMDFGIARAQKSDGLTQTGTIIGTPEYMAPEQLEGETVDFRTDIYALGVVLYESLTGRVPFKGTTFLGVALKHKTERPLDPRELNPKVPEPLNGLIMRCLEKDRAARFQNAGEVRDILRQVAA
jgi:CheY-like chemotaxis protein/predicted Ser/Thr protein kinase